MDILYTTNKKYMDVMLASISSIYKNGCLDSINLHIIYNDFSIDEILYVERFLKSLSGVSFSFYFLDDKEIDKYGIPKWKGSHIANARLFFESILKDKVPDHILYIDADTICVADISNLEEYDKFPIYAVRDTMHECYYNKFEGMDKYYNSGVLYINTKKWREMRAEGRIVDFLLTNPYELFYPDQDALNNALSGSIGDLGIEYNLPPHAYLLSDDDIMQFYTHRSIIASEIIEAKEKAKICHSYGFSGIKPWMNNKVNPYNDLFMEYLYAVNPNFKKEEMSFLKKLYASNKKIFYELLMLKSDLSSFLVEPSGNSLNKKNHFFK